MNTHFVLMNMHRLSLFDDRYAVFMNDKILLKSISILQFLSFLLNNLYHIFLAGVGFLNNITFWFLERIFFQFHFHISTNAQFLNIFYFRCSSFI